MKNKLLTSTAIAGSLMMISYGSAIAQTKIGGNVNLSYKAIGASGTTSATNASRFMGKEIQIDLSNSGKLNNGLSYAAGFSIEHDGTQMSSQSSTTATDALGALSENVYIDFISGNTTLSFGADHGLNPDNEPANLVGVVDFDDLISGVNNATPKYAAKAGSSYEAFGVHASQKTDFGTFIVRYVPDATTGLAAPDDGALGDRTSQLDAAESKYEVGFRGDLGVKGLDLQAFYNKQESGNSAAQSATGKTYGVKYLVGQFGVGASQKETSSAAAVPVNIKSNAYGVSYAVDKDITVGLSYAVTNNDTSAATSAAKEKIKQVSVGYNLGPVFTGVSYGQVSNVANAADKDGSAAFLFMGTKF